MNRTRKQLLPNGQPHVRQHPIAGGVKLTTFVPLQFKKRGIQKVIVPPDGVEHAVTVSSSALPLAPQHDLILIKALALAQYWQQQLDNGQVTDAAEIARREQKDRTRVNELLRLALLAPDVIASIVAGETPQTLTLESLLRTPLPADWQSQRQQIQAIHARSRSFLSR